MSKKLGNLVKEARTEKGMTQEALAKKVKGLTASDISKIERGEMEPTQAVLKEIAKVLGVTQTSLISAASGKTSAARTGSGTAKAKTAKTTSKTASKTTAAKKTTADLKLTAAEKKLVQAYRKADAATKKTAVSLLEGNASAGDLIMALISAKTGNAAKPSSGNTASGLEGLLGSLLGGKADASSEKPAASSGKTEGSLLSSLLENLMGK